MSTVYLLLGTNLGDRENNLERARQQIKAAMGRITQSSRLYETAAWGLEQQQAFLNQVLAVETNITPWELLTQITIIESRNWDACAECDKRAG